MNLTIKEISLINDEKRYTLIDKWGDEYSMEMCDNEISVYDCQTQSMMTSIPLDFIPFICKLLGETHF